MVPLLVDAGRISVGFVLGYPRHPGETPATEGDMGPYLGRTDAVLATA
ncbi:hypothetical protein [Mycobacterium sp. NPDC050853]